MVLAVPEHRHLQDSRIAIPGNLELLGKDRMGHRCVRSWVPTVCKDNSSITRDFQKILEIAADVLNGERIDGSIVAGLADWLHPNPAEDAGVVIFEKAHQGIQEPKSLSSVSPRCSSPQSAPEIGSLDFGEDASEARTARPDQIWIEARFRFNKRARQILQEPLIDHEAGNDQDRRYIPMRWLGREIPGIAGLIYIANAQRGAPLTTTTARRRP